MIDFKGKRMVVTGANGALGRAASARVLALGAELVQLDIAHNNETLAADARVQQIEIDLSDTDAVKQCFAQLGAIDAVLNIAGGFAMGTPVHETDDEQWDFLFKLNVRTMHNVVKACVPGMIERGRGAIVNVGADGARSGAALLGPYCASKSVVMRLTESLAGELKDKGINVNAVLPGVIDTPANREGMPDADPAQWVAPDDLANVMCFLASDAARGMHGALVPVTGLGG